MKKSLFSLVMILMMFFVFSQNESKATCPTGYTASAPITFNYSYMYGGISRTCEVTFYYCYKELGRGFVDIIYSPGSIQWQFPLCPGFNPLSSDLWNVINNKTLQNLSTIPSDWWAGSTTIVPPCSTNHSALIVTISRNNCMKAIKTIVGGSSPTSGGTVLTLTFDCDATSKCQKTYSICNTYNPVTGEYLINILNTWIVSTATPECPLVNINWGDFENDPNALETPCASVPCE